MAEGNSGRRRGRKQAPGQPNSDALAEEAAQEMVSPVEESVMDIERDEWSNSPGFARMKMAWTGPEKEQMDRIQNKILEAFSTQFSDVLSMMNDLYDLVREPEVNEVTGEMVVDADGFKVWARNPITGAYIEDWSVLTHRHKEHFLFQITANIFEWEQRSAQLWTEAMYGKAQFTETWALAYDEPLTGTIEDRTAAANAKAAEARYFALMLTSLSRRAEALVRTMNALALRMKDTL